MCCVCACVRARTYVWMLGATASVQSNPGFSAFSSAKHGLRAVAGSLARELAPDGKTTIARPPNRGP